ncbi:MAG: MvaI/BcnI family restriction endonuclease [Nanoarchaeota archaeon]|nr:MvaI/BcnI restriction endonuclease family protein [Nanoarchaeota archaeon]MBU4300716.1 MvaI/BcnI restriction endonuclease family protein [Nanoarchaeota archaeon]MBU4451771.1 MvaI/BcnI restriction endonuclease family protein [Nanoarchaeota archaeon]
MELLNIKKEELLEKLRAIKKLDWIHTNRSKNDGAVGNTLEDLLHIPENNLAIANTVDWELKTQRKSTGSLITLFHQDPEPRKPKSVVANVLLPKYGWPHDEAGKMYPKGEMSFRATLTGNRFTDRGLKVNVNSVGRKVEIFFDPEKVDKQRHGDWLTNVLKYHLVGATVLASWDFDVLNKKCAGKIRNTIYVIADSRKVNEQEEFKYEKIELLEDFAFNNLLRGILNGVVFVDFDARTGHNHGTKFRIKQNNWPALFSKVTEI